MSYVKEKNKGKILHVFHVLKDVFTCLEFFKQDLPEDLI